MGLFRPSREARGPDPYLHLKMALLVAGAAVGLFGMAREDTTIVYIGIAVLAAGVLLRFLPGRRGD